MANPHRASDAATKYAAMRVSTGPPPPRARASTTASGALRGKQPTPLLNEVPGVPPHDGRAGHMLKQGAGTKSWKRRWFVLPRNTDRLLWWDEDRNWQAQKPHRGVRLVAVELCAAEDCAPPGHVAFDVWASELGAADRSAAATGGKKPAGKLTSNGGMLTRMLRRNASGSGGGETPGGVRLPSGCNRFRLAASSHAEAQKWVCAIRACVPSAVAQQGQQEARQQQEERIPDWMREEEEAVAAAMAEEAAEAEEVAEEVAEELAEEVAEEVTEEVAEAMVRENVEQLPSRASSVVVGVLSMPSVERLDVSDGGSSSSGPPPSVPCIASTSTCVRIASAATPSVSLVEPGGNNAAAAASWKDAADVAEAASAPETQATAAAEAKAATQATAAAGATAAAEAKAQAEEQVAADAKAAPVAGATAAPKEPEATSEATAAAAVQSAQAEAAAAHATALRLCRKTEPLSVEEEDELLDLVTALPAAFVVPDSRDGIAPVHWLCASPSPSAAAIDELLEALPSAASCKDSRGCLPLHWAAANDALGAELLLLVLEASENAASAVDNFRQLPLHWLCTSALEDPRALTLLLDAHTPAAAAKDRQGRTPAHVLCASSRCSALAPPLRSLLELAPACASVADSRGQTALHVLCSNCGAVDAETLGLLTSAHPAAASSADLEGNLPLHYLSKSHPEAGDLWQIVIKAAEASGGGGGGGASAGGAPGGAGASSNMLPVMVGGDGAVAGIRGRVKDVLHTGVQKEARAEDRGLLLFTSSMTAVKATAESCRKGAALLEALMIEFELRDVFVNLEYANQLRRLHAATGGDKESAGSIAEEASGTGAAGGKGRGRGLPELPRLYANGNLIGGLAELIALDDEGRLASTLQPYRLEHQRGKDIDRRSCDECGGKRFVVCSECSGSRRGRKVFDKYMKCSHCNENGLMACAACNVDERKKPHDMT